ncbi:MAG: 30S ribosomal protein S19 [Candidatus Micrarchaeota archaeon]
MARKFVYRGKSIEELSNMTLEELMPFVSSRVRRSLKRAQVKYKKLLTKARNARKLKLDGKDVTIKTQIREAIILPEWVGIKFGVHNGKEFKIVMITPDMVGYRLGEFAHSTGRVLHSGPGVGATRGSKFIPLK